MKKILVTVGNDHHSFHRLIKAVDELSGNSAYDFIIQYGYSSYVPRFNKNNHRFFAREEFYQAFNEADLIISHAGIGTLIDTIQNRKKLILVPKRHKYKEHFNDHQLEVAQEVEGKYQNIRVVYETDSLAAALKKMLEEKVSYPDPPRISSLGMIQDIRDFIENGAMISRQRQGRESRKP